MTSDGQHLSMEESCVDIYLIAHEASAKATRFCAHILRSGKFPNTKPFIAAK